MEAWITFLKECSPNGDSKVIKELTSRKEAFNTVMVIMEQLSADEIEYQRYLAREKYLMDEISRKQYAERKNREFENMKREMEKNKLEIEKSKEDLEMEKSKINNAVVNLHKKGFGAEEIASLLNISNEEVNLAMNLKSK